MTAVRNHHHPHPTEHRRAHGNTPRPGARRARPRADRTGAPLSPRVTSRSLSRAVIHEPTRQLFARIIRVNAGAPERRRGPQNLSLPRRGGEAVAILRDFEQITVAVDAEAAWATEVDRRVAELDSGAVKTIPWPKCAADSPRADASVRGRSPRAGRRRKPRPQSGGTASAIRPRRHVFDASSIEL